MKSIGLFRCYVLRDSMIRHWLFFGSVMCWAATCQDATAQKTTADKDPEPVRVFIFAGQSNMVGSDSKVEDIDRFPPFAGLQQPQNGTRFSYCIGRENKTVSEGWVPLQPVNNIVGPELSFAREVTKHINAPIAIIKIAAGGTHLGGDWNPDKPSGFKLYPLALETVRRSLANLQSQGLDYRIEGFMWHQGENDMFDETYMANYGKNLQNFIASWRRDLETPELRFYIGELCTKTIWGMDLRPRMYAISLGQKDVATNDAFAQYVPTSHIGVEIGGGAGLHYHYGTLGQLEHGINYATAYLKNIDRLPSQTRPLDQWPYAAGSKVKLFVLAGHRNMEGERAFVQQLDDIEDKTDYATLMPKVAYRYSIGGGVKVSDNWEPLGPTGPYDTFGPELSFSNALASNGETNFAIAKFTHSGSQIIDWTPEGSEAKSRNLYPQFIDFIQNSMADLESRGHEVEIAGIFYHVGENDMSWGPFRKDAARRVMSMIQQSRLDLNLPSLNWFISQQRPTDHESVNAIDVVSDFERLLMPQQNVVYVQAFDPTPQEKQLVFDTQGIIWLGKQLAASFSNHVRSN